MAETQIRGRLDEMLESFERRAKANGRTFDEEMKWVIARGEKFSPEEAVAAMRYMHSFYRTVQPSMTLDEIREGLM
jgi:hypothetical protein